MARVSILLAVLIEKSKLFFLGQQWRSQIESENVAFWFWLVLELKKERKKGLGLSKFVVEPNLVGVGTVLYMAPPIYEKN